MQRRDSEMFREAVDWESLGLVDYLVVIKTPMDLGTVRKKLDGREYRKQEECVSDIRLIWSNSMLYNAPGSKVYSFAKALSDYFESQWLPVCKDDADRPATQEEMKAWAENCHKIGQEELGRVLGVLESVCPQCLVKKLDTNEVEINVDLIFGKAFREVRSQVDALLSEGPRKKAKV